MLSRRATWLLRTLRDLTDADLEPDLVREGRAVWIGAQKMRNTTLDQLIRCCAVSSTYRSGDYEAFAINSTGRSILRRPELADEVAARIMTGPPFRVVEDRIADLEEPAGA